MINRSIESPDAWTKPSKAVFDFWVSFWPVAPAFGVEWRFAELMPRFTPRILEEGATASKPKTRAAAKKAKPAPVETAPEPADAVTEAMTETMEAVEAVVETAAAMTEATAEAVHAAAETVHEETPKKPHGLLPTAPVKADDLKMIKGIGPSLEKQLNALGIYTFDQMAGFGEGDLVWIDENLTSFKGRCFRDDWVGQAAALKA